MSLVSVALVSLTVLAWPVMLVRVWYVASSQGFEDQVDLIEAWHRPVFTILFGAMVLSFFGRPRLIVPIVVACLGVTLFWLYSTAP